MTFAYFYPRNEIMFRAAQLNDVTLLRETWASWSAMNWVRSSILLAGVILSCVSLHKIYSIDDLRTCTADLQKGKRTVAQVVHSPDDTVRIYQYCRVKV